MNWGNFKDKILSRIHDRSLAAEVPEWLNEVQQEMVAAAQWRHLDADKILPTVAPFITGTVSVTNGLATLTFTNTLPAIIAGQLFVAGGHYYKILTRDTAFTATLDSTYISTTNAAASFQIISYQLTLPTDFSPPRLYTATIQTGDGVNLLHYTPDHLLFEEWPDESKTIGQPTNFRFHAGKMILWPPPDGVYNVRIWYHRVPNEFTTTTADSTDLDWPTDLRYALLQGVFAIGYEHIDDSIADRCRSRFENSLRAAVARNNRAPGVGAGRLQRWDRGASHRRMNYRLPEPIG
jgi:hypothetical protein